MTHDELMRYLDGELPPEEGRRVEEALAGSTELQRELAIFRGMKEDLRELSFTLDFPRSVWDRVNRRIARPVGWIFLVTGAVLWAAYGSWVFITSPADPWEKLAVGTLAIGFVILLASTVWERYRESLTDPYRHVQR